jgi:hypothetical protein
MGVVSWILRISLFRSVSIAQDEVHTGMSAIFLVVLKAREEWRSCCLVLISHGFRWVFKHPCVFRIDAKYLCISVVLEFLRWWRRWLGVRASRGDGFVRTWRPGIRLLVCARPPLVRERVGLEHRDVLRLLF